jgi:glycine cleavage system transcriptional repressor
MATRKPIQYLAISAIGADRPGIADDLCKHAVHCGCNILDTRMTTLGTEFVANLLLSGAWSAIAKFEAGIPTFEKKNDLKINCRRTQPRSSQRDRLPYSIYIIAMELPGIVQKITHFFAAQQINIHDFHLNTYTAPHSETQMLSLNLAVTVAKNQLLADFRENLMVFCDDHNLDVVLEPQKS